ncbi:MAG: prepilin-type N-terminal cleavage/methylation domain-containing protein [Sulfuricurvum sp.]|nr:prepilin-type N-terminal cleavage/methylation domain-containing protein [Sulfuricurvum sp.]
MKHSKKAFTLIEVTLTIFLVGVISALSYFYLNTDTLKRSQYKTAIQSHANLIEAMVFQCKNLSEQFPEDLNTTSLANNTLLTALECNTSTPYNLDGGRNGFVPVPPTGFSAYTATESGSTFYITTTAENNSTQDKALISLALNYTSTQATLDHNATSATFKFYLSR